MGLLQHKEADAKVRNMRTEVKVVKKEYDKTEDDLKALQSVGQIIGEVLRQLDEERFIVKASSGPRYVVGCRNKIEKAGAEHARLSGHDHPHDHARAAAGGRPRRLQHAH